MGVEDVQPRAAAEGGYRRSWVQSAACSVQGADGAWFRAQVLLALSCGGGILLRWLGHYPDGV